MKSPDRTDLLIFTDWYLPGYKAGGPVVSCANLVRALSERMRIAVVCGDRDYCEEQPYPNVKTNAWTRREHARVCYLSPEQRSYRRIAELIAESDPRTVYINGMFSKVFSLFPLLAVRRAQSRVILAPRGMLAPGALGLKSFKKRAFLTLAKGLGLYRGICFHATHHHEAEHIRRVIGPKVQIQTLPNLPSLPEAPVSRKREKERGSLRVLTVARIAREKNILFIAERLAEMPEDVSVRWVHVGPVYDSAYAEKCKSVRLPKNIVAEWRGALTPEDIQKCFAETDLFFLPTLGENYGHAIAESLLYGVPALISDATPHRNLAAKNAGADLPIDVPKAHTDFLVRIARMSEREYRASFGNLAADTRAALDIASTLRAYQKLFG